MNFKVLYLFPALLIGIFPQQKLTIDDILYNKEFRPAVLNDIHWFENGDKYCTTEYDSSSKGESVFQYETSSSKRTLLVSLAELRSAAGNENFETDNFQLSPGANYLLFTGSMYARSLKTGGSFFVFDISSRKIILNIESDEEQVNINFSPDETKVGFVRNNNLYIASLQSGEVKQLTFDGSSTILNGVFDWAYEEEFSIIEGWCWSPDSKSIAFWRLDQTQVPQFPVTEFDSVYNQVNFQYYPKPGFPVSRVRIGVVNIESELTTWINTGTEEDIYIPRIKFTPDPNILSVQRLNRPQNKLELLFADISTGESEIILTEEDEHWVDVWDHLTFLSSSRQFIWPSEKDGYLHLYLYDYSGSLVNRITSGNYEVEGLAGIDESKGLLYYTSNERSVIHKDLYVINIDGTGKKRLSLQPGNHKINMSPGCKYYIDTYSTANSLPAISLYSTNSGLVRVLTGNDMSFIEAYNFSPVEFNTFTTSDGTELNYFLIKPHDFNPGIKYPVVILNYSGPGSQSVTDSWMGRDYYLSQLYAQAGFFVFTVDNRGTGGKGKEFEHIVYKNLGKWELNDITEGLHYLNTLGYADTTRVCITGSSYGGYITALAMLDKPAYFKIGVAVSAVTDWKYYDAIYTERFMQQPASNPEGYTKSSALTYAGGLEGKLFLIHGTADDNVHFHNSVELADVLIKANKKFDIMIYPGKKHGGFGKHFYHLVTDYILNNL